MRCLPLRKLLKIELSRAFQSKLFLIAALLGLGLALWHVVGVVLPASAALSEVVDNHVLYPLSVFNKWMGFESVSLQAELFYTLLPLLAVLPFADSFYADKKSGYLKNLFIRTKKRHYFVAKYCAVFLSGAAALAVPLVASLGLTAAILPSLPPEPATSFFTVNELLLWNDIFVSTPYLYVFLIILLNLLFGGLLAVLAIALSDLIGNRFAILLAPFLLYLFTKYLVIWISAEQTHPYFFLRADQGLINNASFGVIAAEIAALALLTIGLFIGKGVRDEVY